MAPKDIILQPHFAHRVGDRPSKMHSILERRFECDMPPRYYSVQNGTEQYCSSLYGIVLNSLSSFSGRWYGPGGLGGSG